MSRPVPQTRATSVAPLTDLQIPWQNLQPLLRVVVYFGAVVILALAYLTMSFRAQKLHKEIGGTLGRIEDIEMENESLRTEQETRNSVESLEKVAHELGLQPAARVVTGGERGQ